jgi:hypothetical protein
MGWGPRGPVKYYMDISQGRFYKISGLSKTSARSPSADSLSDPNSVGRFPPKGSVSVGHPAFLPFAASENRNLRGQHSFNMGFRTNPVSGAGGCPGGEGWRLPASEICKGPIGRFEHALPKVSQNISSVLTCPCIQEIDKVSIHRETPDLPWLVPRRFVFPLHGSKDVKNTAVSITVPRTAWRICSD